MPRSGDQGCEWVGCWWRRGACARVLSPPAALQKHARDVRGSLCRPVWGSGNKPLSFGGHSPAPWGGGQIPRQMVLTLWGPQRDSYGEGGRVHQGKVLGAETSGICCRKKGWFPGQPSPGSTPSWRRVAGRKGFPGSLGRLDGHRQRAGQVKAGPHNWTKLPDSPPPSETHRPGF